MTKEEAIVKAVGYALAAEGAQMGQVEYYTQIAQTWAMIAAVLPETNASTAVLDSN